MMYLLTQFLLALLATLGFSVIFRVPLKKIPACVLVGALGWITYIITVHYLGSPVAGCFTGACMVGMLSSICARCLKEASTIFIIPGILCLVPGSNIYKTMEALLLHNYENTAEIGVQTLFMAGAIAIGLLVIVTIVGLLRITIRKIKGRV
ncbi:MAG: threonine/serine exporter family protein [Bacillota bacterium]|nr:threonine/serine exporter family protein [Bacillota bacterium]